MNWEPIDTVERDLILVCRKVDGVPYIYLANKTLSDHWTVFDDHFSVMTDDEFKKTFACWTHITMPPEELYELATD